MVATRLELQVRRYGARQMLALRRAIAASSLNRAAFAVSTFDIYLEQVSWLGVGVRLELGLGLIDIYLEQVSWLGVGVGVGVELGLVDIYLEQAGHTCAAP